MPTKAKPKPKAKASPAPKARGPKSLEERLVATLRRGSPRNESEGIVEISLLKRENNSRVKHVLRTGLAPFDAMCGGDEVPGLPFGKIVELYGPEMSGKTALAVRAAVKAKLGEIYEVVDRQKKKFKKISLKDCDVTVLFVDNEGTLDDNQNIIVDGVKLDCVAVRCDTVTQLFKTIDKAVDMLRTEQKTSKRPQFLVVVVDTIAGTSSKEELAQEWGKDDYSRMPKQLRQGFRKMVRKISRNNVLFIATNQVGDNFKQQKKKGGGAMQLPSESDYTSAGGKAVKYFARVRVFVQVARDDYFLAKSKPKEKRFSAGFVGQMYCKKNTQVSPSTYARFVLFYGKRGGGLNDLYSRLEQFCFMKMAVPDADYGVTFLFKPFGVEPTTFGDVQTTLEEDDDQEDELEDEDEEEDGDEEAARIPRGKHPYLEARNQWPSFYAAHKADFDALWDRCVEKMFEGVNINDLPGIAPARDVVEDNDQPDEPLDDEGDDEDEDEDEGAEEKTSEEVTAEA